MSNHAALRRRKIELNIGGDEIFRLRAVPPPVDSQVTFSRVSRILGEKLLPSERETVARLKGLSLAAEALAPIVGKAVAIREERAFKDEFEKRITELTAGNRGSNETAEELAALLVLAARAKHISPHDLITAAEQHVSLIAPSPEQQLRDFRATKARLSARVANESRGQAFAADLEKVRRKLEACAELFSAGQITVEFTRYAVIRKPDFETRPAERLDLVRRGQAKKFPFGLFGRAPRTVLASLCRETGSWAGAASASVRRKWSKSAVDCSELVNYGDNPACLKFSAHAYTPEFTSILNNTAAGKALQEHFRKVVIEYKLAALESEKLLGS